VTLAEWPDFPFPPVAVPTEQLPFDVLAKPSDAEPWGCPTCGHAPHGDRHERACDADSCPCQAVGS
jgi:hypothetical protein